jgi:indole-3-glycerol phosphate synthase
VNILDKIASEKNRTIKERDRSKKVISFSQAIKAKNRKKQIALISEIKPKSPSQGELRKIQDAVSIANIMQDNGATAISVLTEANYFGGNIETLIDLSEKIKLPLLRKDFITSEAEIEESYNCNADAVLLIVGLLKERTGTLLNKCEERGIEALVEVHNEAELRTALEIGTKIIGINNRNLETMRVNLETTGRLIDLIPRNRIIISESGVQNKRDAEYLASLSVNAILVGTTLMKSSDLGKVVKELSEIKIA